jgi:hypothetical protein
VGRIALLLTGLAVLAAAAWVAGHGVRAGREARGGSEVRGVDKREAPWLRVAQASTVVILFYLLVTCLWFQSWYTLWPLSLAVLLPEGPLATAAVLLTVTGIWKPIYFDLILNRGALPPRVQRELVLGPMVLGVDWLFAVVALARAGWHGWPHKKPAETLRAQWE